uniref:Uncharacterized protein n=1 Tax=Kuenenia stuttgartiensis TaxID=174633 RepID=Q1Q3F3_KUEST|nr:unknown protein [Candidatus Kuenenia stuttgartiensis]
MPELFFVVLFSSQGFSDLGFGILPQYRPHYLHKLMGSGCKPEPPGTLSGLFLSSS